MKMQTARRAHAEARAHYGKLGIESTKKRKRSGECLKNMLVLPQTCRYIRLALTKAYFLRRGGRVVECTALEMRHACEGIGGSNPSLSAINH